MKASASGSSSRNDRRVSQVIFADAMQSQNSIRLTDVLRRQKWVILVMISLGLAMASLYWTRARVWYESTAKVLVSQRDPRMASSGAASAPAEDMVDEDVLANHMEVLRSREIVVNALDRHKVKKAKKSEAKVEGPERPSMQKIQQRKQNPQNQRSRTPKITKRQRSNFRSCPQF